MSFEIMKFRTFATALTLAIFYGSISDAKSSSPTPTPQTLPVWYESLLTSDQSPNESREGGVNVSPLSIRIIEDPKRARERYESERKSEALAEEALEVQRKLNRTTEIMTDATARMARYSWWATVFGAVGSALLIFTLALNFRSTTIAAESNKAAFSALELNESISRDQLRPWLLPYTPSITDMKNVTYPDGVTRPIGVCAAVGWRNNGQSPATQVQLWLFMEVVDRGGTIPDFSAPPYVAGTGIIAPGVSVWSNRKFLDADECDRFMNGELDMIIYSHVHYTLALNPSERRSSEITYRAHRNGDRLSEDGKSFIPNFEISSQEGRIGAT